MEKVNNNSEIELLKDNKIVGEPDLQNSFIRFEGENNVLFCENDVVIGNSKIVFNGDNGVVYLSSNKHKYFLNITIYRDALIYIGKNNYFNGQFNIISSERKNVIIGEGSVFSFGIWARTADPHIIYDAKTHKRINQSKSIVIGDHTWIGQNAIILKNTFVGFGSVLAAMSVAAGKTLQSNAIYAGNPIRKKRKNIFFSGESTHNYTKKQTKSSLIFNDNCYIYEKSENEKIDIGKIEKELGRSTSSEDKIALINSQINNNKTKNRFVARERTIFELFKYTIKRIVKTVW